MKYFWILLFCTGSCFGQTRAQLKQQLAEADDFIRTLVTANASLRSQLNEANANIDGFVKMVADEETQIADLRKQNTALRNTNELLVKIADVNLSTTRTVVVPMPALPSPAPAPQTIVIREDAPYRPPALDWPSPVNCSGYEIPTPGLTLTYGNCH